MKTKVFTKDAKEKGTFELPEDIFGAAWKPALIKQVVLAFLANARRPVAHTKGRGEVSGGGKKPWRQKGTGRARHGSIRSPIWVGGGVAHGPRNEKDYSQKVNKKMKKTALKSVLSRKLNEGEILLVDELNFEEPKTKEAKKVVLSLSSIEGFEKLSYKKKNAAVIIAKEPSFALLKSFSNFGNIDVKPVKDLNVYDVLKYKYVLFVNPEESIAALQERLQAK